MPAIQRIIHGAQQNKKSGPNSGIQHWHMFAQVTQEVKIDASVLFMEKTPEIEAMIETLPEWTNAMPFTGFQRSFAFWAKSEWLEEAKLKILKQS